MVHKKIISDRVSRFGEERLSPDDINILKKRRNKQLLVLASGYLPFIAFGFYFLLMGASSMNTGHRIYRLNIDDDARHRFWTMLPYFLGFVFLMLNIYFGKLYFESIRPLTIDLKNAKKRTLFFKPEKTEMAFFNRYYISTPLFKNQQIEISRENFNTIGTNDELCIEMGPASAYILRLRNEEHEIAMPVAQ